MVLSAGAAFTRRGLTRLAFLLVMLAVLAHRSFAADFCFTNSTLGRVFSSIGRSGEFGVVVAADVAAAKVDVCLRGVDALTALLRVAKEQELLVRRVKLRSRKVRRFEVFRPPISVASSFPGDAIVVTIRCNDPNAAIAALRRRIDSSIVVNPDMGLGVIRARLPGGMRQYGTFVSAVSTILFESIVTPSAQ